ncbi:MAG TPA: tetratricopeptide repeat protein [Vicinamibacteria bacterium]|nr:tetratricopeptide repeat protein [Vicinamibacteria bacterium]
MKMTGALLTTLALAATVAHADKRVDDAYARAESQIEKGRPEEAVKTMDKAVNQQPTSPEAHLALARVQLRVGNLDEGATAASKAVELSASASPAVQADVFSTVSGLTLRRGAGKEALAQAERGVKALETPGTLAALSRAQARTQQSTASLETAQKAMQLGPTVAAAHHAHGEALLALRRPGDAEPALRKAIELDPKLTIARSDLALALLAQGKTKEAVDEARKATEVDAQSGEAFAVLGTAILAADKNNWSDAIAQAQQGAFLNPRNPVVQVSVGRIFEAANNFDQATSAYRRALDADPGYVPARSALLKMQVLRGDLDAALIEAGKLTQDAPENAEAQLVRGRILLRKGEFGEAVSPLEMAAKFDPQNAEAHALLGTAYQYTRESDNALESYQKAVQLSPHNTDYRSTYGLLLALNKKYAEGVAELKKVVATPGYKDAAAWVNLGWVYRNMEPSNAPESIATYTKSLEIDPKNEQAALGLGWAHSYQRNYDQAIAAFQKAIQLDPKTAGEALNGIAWSYLFKKDVAQAKVFAEKAKAAGRNDARLLTNIDRFEKGMAAAEEAEREFREQQQRAQEGPDVGTLGAQAMRGNSSGKKNACRQLIRFGRPAVEFLAYAAINDPDLSVREVCIASLGAVGAAARDQCAQLQSIATRPNPYESTIMERKQLDQMVQYEDVKRAAKAAVSRIGCN